MLKDWKHLTAFIFGSLVFLLVNHFLYAHKKPIKTEKILAGAKTLTLGKSSITSAVMIQNLSFGSFGTGTMGGTVTIPSVGSRRATGDVFLIVSDSGFPAILQLTTDSTNFITFTTGNIVNLTNNNGNSISLQINDFYPASPFNPVIGQNNVKIGGTLTINAQSGIASGNYSGSFEITFNEQ